MRRGSSRPAAALLAAALLAGCSSSLHSSSSGLKISAYVVHANEQTGYRVLSGPRVAGTLGAYLSSDLNAAHDAVRLQSEGFRQAASVSTGSGSGSGGSAAIELASAAAASREQLYSFHNAVKRAARVRTVLFRVVGIPGSTGVLALGSPHASANVYFREGRCELWIGDTNGDEPVVAAAQSIWAATHDKPGVCVS